MTAPPHQEWDCAINLKEGAIPPRCRTYPLSQEESGAMERYISEAMAQGYIRPFMSPASAGVFFVKKKDGGLRPCVDYRGLNEVLIKYPYALPLVPAVLELVREAQFFGRLVSAPLLVIMRYQPPLYHWNSLASNQPSVEQWCRCWASRAFYVSALKPVIVGPLTEDGSTLAAGDRGFVTMMWEECNVSKSPEDRCHPLVPQDCGHTLALQDCGHVLALQD
ncbi:hypothetical protein P4O66_011201, partial [Electrophorus voltai]